MIVKQLLEEAILNLNLNARDPKVLASAVRLFNGIMRRYSGNNVMTAYQNSVDFVADKENVTVGKYNLKDGYRDVGVFDSVSDLPNSENFVAGVDMAYVGGKFYTPGYMSWQEVQFNPCSFFPDVLRTDVSDAVSLIVKNGYNWKEMDRVPYSFFYTDDRSQIFSYKPIGENKLEIMLKGCSIGKTMRLIYTTSMKFDENSVLELPEIYLPLVNAALTEDLGNAFPAVDSTIVDKYSGLRARLESDIMSKNTDDRMVLRKEETPDYSFHRVDMFM